ncbi:stage V sporulation protein AD [Carboxydothermus pertinax]|uniref:Stage V sporulation protein AD n=1 Tax=Carboxydothermus pertinax TaxID=870242 RepID=A0A1L8CTT7_9THEO|nr:stage V sporulation protein AD [Carboxydothermus pertinax]GAV22331.1 stage V sporulation protein AD [Carboxydothermus pertinax]
MKKTREFSKPPVVLSYATIAGPKEGEGPLASYFDKVINNLYYYEDTWEKAEQKMLLEVAELALKKASVNKEEVDFFLAGDLLNQIISANFVARNLGIPFLGLYSACATFYEGLVLGAMLIAGGFAKKVLVGVSSHYATSERQYRNPTEQGVQKTPTAQWTVTGAVAVLLGEGEGKIKIPRITVGKAVDYGLADPSDMGGAMVPAAFDTLLSHFKETGLDYDYYDLLATGDLASFGHQLLVRLLKEQGISFGSKLTDCGIMIYHPEQQVNAGGSGAACSALVTAGYVFNQLSQGKITKFLGLGTGALLSQVTTQQGMTIPAIAHAVSFESY